MTNTRVEPYIHRPAAVVDHDPVAVDVAAEVARLLIARMPELRVEHIGSTAVPACAGKGIVDLMALYPAGRLEEARAAVDGAGFQPQTFGEPFPETRPMRVGTLVHGNRRHQVHIHVLAEDDDEVRRLRSFRDRLRADPSLVRAYVDRKLDLVEAGVVGSPDYARGKGGFIRAVLVAHVEERAPTPAPAGGRRSRS